MADRIIIFSGKQYSGKDTVAKIMLAAMPDFRRCAMGDIIKLTYGKEHNLTYEEIEKNKPIYRQDLINLGNWGRSQDPDYWLKKIIEQVKNMRAVFADVDEYLCLDPNDVEKKITSKTKAVIFVGYGGRFGKLDKIIEILASIECD